MALTARPRLAIAAAAGTWAPTAPPNAAAAENGFALSLLPLIGGPGNAVYSPYSVDTALTMAGAGAKGPTAAQIDRVLGASSAPAATADAAALLSAIGSAAPNGPSGVPKLDVGKRTLDPARRPAPATVRRHPGRHLRRTAAVDRVRHRARAGPARDKRLGFAAHGRPDRAPAAARFGLAGDPSSCWPTRST